MRSLQSANMANLEALARSPSSQSPGPRSPGHRKQRRGMVDHLCPSISTAHSYLYCLSLYLAMSLR